MGGEQPSPTLSPAELLGWLAGAESTVATTQNMGRTCPLLRPFFWTCCDTHESSGKRHHGRFGEVHFKPSSDERTAGLRDA